MTERRSGPVRSEAARLAILQATARQFAARGYDSLTMEGIAADAGVGKQTIYRWWRSKGEVVAECLLEGLLLPDRLTPPDTGDLRRDLVAWIDEIQQLRRPPEGESMVRSLIGAAAVNPEVGARLRDSLGGSASLEGRFESAIRAGQLRSDAPLDSLAEALVGAILLHALGRADGDSGYGARLVGAILDANAVANADGRA